MSPERRQDKNAAAKTDASLIRGCLRGEQPAWNTLVSRYERLVYAVALRSGICASDADDVFQAVFLSLFRSLDSLKENTPLPAWLITTTSRESWRVAARRPRNRSHESALSFHTVESPDALELLERQQLVRQALAELGGRGRRLITALFLGNRPPGYQTIARDLDIPVGSIGPTRARCLKKLKGILERIGFTEESGPAAPR